MNMEEKQIIRHIDSKKVERKGYENLWKMIERLHKNVGLSDSTYNEVKAKVSSKINACDRSICDHKKLLPIDPK